MNLKNTCQNLVIDNTVKHSTIGCIEPWQNQSNLEHGDDVVQYESNQ